MKNLIDWLIRHPFDSTFFLVLLLAVFLRIWKLETHMIFFADAGKDMLSAVQAIETRQIPLLGIESSIPRFRQGPVFIWINALSFILFGYHPVVVGYVVVLMNVIAIAVIYHLIREHVNNETALTSAFILTVSPLAIANSRMPYHIAPMVFAIVLHLLTIIHFNPKKLSSVFLTALSWAFVFQFELAFFPTILILLIWLTPVLFPSIDWKKLHIYNFRNANFKAIGVFIAGLVVGLSPQIIFDLTNKFAQLGGFLAWVGYRMASFIGVVGPHTVSAGRLQITMSAFAQYWTRIFSIDQPLIAAVFITAAILSCIFIAKKWKTVPVLIKYVFGLFIILTAAYIVHGSPSEAYFPPFVLLIPILIGWGVSQLQSKLRFAALILVGVWSLFTADRVVTNNWFVQPTNSNFHYGPSYQTISNAMEFIHLNAENTPFQIASTDEASHFPSYLDNYRMVSTSQGITISNTANLAYFINQQNSDLAFYPAAVVFPFESLEIIKVIKTPEEPEESEPNVELE